LTFSARRPCDLSVAEGLGELQLERWYFDGSVQMCRRFIYRGTKGNPNNFLSKTDCRNACSGTVLFSFLLFAVPNLSTLISEINPCSNGDPLLDSKGDRVLCTGGQLVDSCPQTHYCHVGATVFTTVCCAKRGNTFRITKDDRFMSIIAVM
jgi:hypothetical protein